MGWKIDSCAGSCHLFICVEADLGKQERPTKGEGLSLNPHSLISVTPCFKDKTKKRRRNEQLKCFYNKNILNILTISVVKDFFIV